MYKSNSPGYNNKIIRLLTLVRVIYATVL
ncbi:hypothetical protein A5876_001001, partial [Enterococcus sp. 3C8_DIV0646]